MKQNPQAHRITTHRPIASCVRSMCSAALLLAALPCAAESAHYLVLHEDAAGQVSVGYHNIVEMAGIPRLEASTDWDGHGTRLDRRLSARVVTDGNVQFSSDVATARWLRGEFPGQGSGSDAGMQASHIERSEFDYVVRVPLAAAGSRLLLSRPGNAFSSATLLDLDLDELSAASSSNRFAAAGTVIPLIQSGDPGNRLDLLVLAEGYTADQQARFQQDATQMINNFLSISPYKDYRNLVNATGLFLVSQQAGASKPACAETPTSPVISVSTALGAKFCSSDIRRLVTVEDAKAYVAAAAAPGWDALIVLVNDSEYGGSGGGLTVATTNSSVVQLVQHEFGHSFTDLADEYSSPYPGFPACSDTGSSKCEANVTDNLASLKWQGWVQGGTSLPTVSALADPVGAGAWLGARYQTSGMYRQCYSGIMRTFSTPFFCHVDGEAYAKRLYSAGWGVPSGGISIIEPKSLQPAAASVTGGTGSIVNFKATVAGPDKTLTATWAVDGQVKKTETPAHGATVSYDYPLAAGQHTVVLSVTDSSAVMLTKQTATQTWQVSGSGTDTTTTKPDSERLMNWAEQTYPDLFKPAGATTQSVQGYQAREYPATQTYIGVKDERVYVYGSRFGGLLDVGSVTSFMGTVSAAGF